MKNTPQITSAMMLAWEDQLGRNRPAPVTPDAAKQAVTILSFNTGAAIDGMYLRLQTAGGSTVDLFLNAAIATQIADVICQNGIAAKWMNGDDRSIIVTDPQNAVHHGRKS